MALVANRTLARARARSPRKCAERLAAATTGLRESAHVFNHTCLLLSLRKLSWKICAEARAEIPASPSLSGARTPQVTKLTAAG